MPETPRKGDIITHEGKKYRFNGVDPDTGQWSLSPVGQSADQSGLAGFARTAAQGATFGFSDELGGVGKFISALAPGGRPIGEARQAYTEGRDVARENLAQFREEHGKTALAAEALGGLATGLFAPGLLAAKAGGAGIRGALGLKKAVDVAKTARTAELAGGLGKGGRIAGKMGQAAKVGALEGGVYGVGAGGEQRGATLGESVLSRAGSGALGAAAGGLLAPAMAGVMGGVGKGREFLRGLQTGRVGKGGTGQIKEAVEEGAEALSERELVKTGGRAAVEADDMAAFGLARLEQTKNPEAFKKRALKWIDAQEKLNSPEYQTYRESGDSELYAGMMSLAEDALKKEADPGAVAGLLADRSGRHRATAALSAKTTQGPQAGLLKEAAGSRPEVVRRALDDVEPAFGERAFEAPGTARTAERLKDEAAELAEINYQAAYDLDDDILRDIYADKGYQDVVERMTVAFRRKQGEWPGLDEALAKARRASVLAATEKRHYAKAKRLQNRAYTDILGSFHTKGSKAGQYKPPNMSSVTRADAAEAIDVFRRTLDNLKESLYQGELRDPESGRIVKKFIKQFDDAIAKNADEFDIARAGYSGRRGIMDTYDDAVSGDILKKSRASIRSHVEKLSRDKVEIGKGGVFRSEYDIFKQGILDDFVDKMDVEDAAAPEKIAKLKKQFEKLFGGENPILDAGDADVKRITQNLDDLAKQSKLSKKIIDIEDPPIQAELEGAVEATAFGYAMAGQPGAAARTGLAAGVYGPGRWENIGGAFARRLRQGEGEGLLSIARSVARTEGRKVGELTRRTAGARAIPGLLGGVREELERGARYKDYGPYAARRRAVQESRRSRGL
jgi:hypothetical protein